MDSKETPSEKRERLRQNELKNNPMGSLNDGLTRGKNSNLVDLSSGMGWKGIGLLILVLVLGFFIYNFIFH